LQGKAIRFVFDRPRAPVVLAEGLERRSPGVLLEVGLDLPALAERLETPRDGAAFLKKVPSLARMAVSAAAQKRQYLRDLPEASPLKHGFLIERATAAVVPLGLEEAVHRITGTSLARSPQALEFALRVLHALKSTLDEAGRGINLDLRLDGESLSAADVAVLPQLQLDHAGKLHARAGAGTATLLLDADAAADIPALIDRLDHVWASTSIVRLQLQRSGATVRQGELAI
jgi:hypothetical protein